MLLTLIPTISTTGAIVKVLQTIDVNVQQNSLPLACDFENHKYSTHQLICSERQLQKILFAIIFVDLPINIKQFTKQLTIVYTLYVQ